MFPGGGLFICMLSDAEALRLAIRRVGALYASGDFKSGDHGLLIMRIRYVTDLREKLRNRLTANTRGE